MRVFVAGAGGAIGRRLVPMLVERGHDVVASMRSADGFAALRALGAQPMAMDGLDAASVGETVARAEPDVVVHEMTALGGFTDLRRFDEGFAITNELRRLGTDHLLAAADAVGVSRVVAQSFTGWPNTRTGSRIKTELDPLDPHPPANQRISLDAIRYLETAVTSARSVEGLVLRYGTLYGPGTVMESEYPALIRDSRSSGREAESGRSCTLRTPPLQPRSQSSAATRGSTTSSTTIPPRLPNGCPTWRRASVRGRHAGSRSAWPASSSARLGSR